jgi:hypothetical protein
MTSPTTIKAELERLCLEAARLITLIGDDLQESHVPFVRDYQRWYTEALPVVQTLAPDRLAEFRLNYQIDPKRKSSSASNYTVQDYVQGIGANLDPATGKPSFDVANAIRLRVHAQGAILGSLRSRIDGVLANIESGLAADLEDHSLATAARLAKVSGRAAGALAGVVVERHLQRVAKAHHVTITKKNPTIADLNDPLRNASIYDTAVWRRIQYIADIRNLCSHMKDREPTPDEVRDLLAGANWVVKNIA